MNGLSIGEVAERAEVHVETLRYYERRGIVEKPPRTPSNYRAYPRETVARVRFVKRAQELGFTLAETKDRLSLRTTPRACRADVRTRAEAKIRDIDQKMRDLRRMKKALSALVADCAGRGSASPCPILEALDSGGRP